VDKVENFVYKSIFAMKPRKCLWKTFLIKIRLRHLIFEFFVHFAKKGRWGFWATKRAALSDCSLYAFETPAGGSD